MQLEATAIDPAWVPVYHRVNNDGSAGCGDVALYATRRYRPSEDFRSDNFRLLDGRPPLSTARIRCEACGSDALARDGWDALADIVAQALEVP